MLKRNQKRNFVMLSRKYRFVAKKELMDELRVVVDLVCLI